MKFYKSFVLFIVAIVCLLSVHREGNALVNADAVASQLTMDGLTLEDEKVLAESKETFVFQAEVNRLMDIIINSLCT